MKCEGNIIKKHQYFIIELLKNTEDIIYYGVYMFLLTVSNKSIIFDIAKYHEAL